MREIQFTSCDVPCAAWHLQANISGFGEPRAGDSAERRKAVAA